MNTTITTSRKRNVEDVDALLTLDTGLIRPLVQELPIATRKTTKNTTEFLIATEYQAWERIDGKIAPDAAKKIQKAWSAIPRSNLATKKLKINGVAQDVPYLKSHHLFAPHPSAQRTPIGKSNLIDAASLALLANILSHARHARAWFNVYGAYEYIPDNPTDPRAIEERKKIVHIDGCEIPVDGMIYRIWDKYNDDKGHKYITRAFDYSLLKIRFISPVDTVWNDGNLPKLDGRVSLDPTQMFRQYFVSVRDASVEWILSLSVKERSLIGVRIIQTAPHVLDATRTFVQTLERQYWVLLLVLTLTPKKVVLKQLADAGILVRPNWYEETLAYIESEFVKLYKIDNFQHVFSHLAGKLQSAENWYAADVPSIDTSIEPIDETEDNSSATQRPSAADIAKDTSLPLPSTEGIRGFQSAVQDRPSPSPPAVTKPSASAFVKPKRFVTRKPNQAAPAPALAPSQIANARTTARSKSAAAEISPELGESFSSSSSSSESSVGFEIMEEQARDQESSSSESEEDEEESERSQHTRSTASGGTEKPKGSQKKTAVPKGRGGASRKSSHG